MCFAIIIVYLDFTYKYKILKIMMEITRNTNDIEHPMYEMMDSAFPDGLDCESKNNYILFN